MQMIKVQKFLRIETPLIENFIEWFQNTFELEEI